MYLNARPSKISFRRLFIRAIVKSEPFVTILDCASAGAKNRRIFNGKVYHGVDINKALIDRAAREYHGDGRSFFYCDDMINFKGPLKNKCFDLVVCTHTLSHVPNEHKGKALQNLIERVSEGGSFILQCALSDDAYIMDLRESFTRVVQYRYRGLISRRYEAILGKIYNTNAIGALGNTGRKRFYKCTKYLVLAMSYFLSFFDRCCLSKSLVVHCMLRKK